MRLWHERAWLSFEPSGLIQFTQTDRLEVQFLRGLARSGLSDAMITRLLNTGLEKPYCYDPAETFFSFFMNTWISLPPEPDPEEVADAYVDGLIRDEDWDALRQFQARISQALAEADALESDGARSSAQHPTPTPR
jgi:hypothetical protein